MAQSWRPRQPARGGAADALLQLPLPLKPPPLKLLPLKPLPLKLLPLKPLPLLLPLLLCCRYCCCCCCC